MRRPDRHGGRGGRRGWRPGGAAWLAASALLAPALLPSGLGAGPAYAGGSAAGGPERVSMERVPLSSPRVQVPQLLALGLDVTEDLTPSSATIVARSDAERARLRAAGFRPVTVVRDQAAVTAGAGRAPRTARGAGSRTGTTAAAAQAGALPGGRTSYRTPDELQADLDRLVAANPGLVRRLVLPRTSVDGRAITGVEIAANVNATGDGRPVSVVLGLHHAREWPSAEIATEFALDLVSRQAEPRIAALLAGLRIIVVPVVNPDGYAYSRGTAPGRQLDVVAALKRRNCRALAGDPAGGSCGRHRGVDLNRNYGAFWGGAGASTAPDEDSYRGTGPWSEPEAAAVHELTQGLPVTGVLALHNVAGLVLRPPGFRALGPAPDEARLKAVGDAMGAATGYPSRYGYELYEVTGATEDWNYVAQGAFGYTIETAGAFAGDTDFQGAYRTHVADQYLGGGVAPGPAGQGVREALLLAAEAAMEARDHTIVRGAAPPGATLRLRRHFDTATSPRCSDTLSSDACGPTSPALLTPDRLDIALVVAASGRFAWHVGPSTRPFVRARGTREHWTLTCERGGGVRAAKLLFADRGQVVDVDPCDAASLPRTGPAARRGGAGRVSAQVPRQRLGQARRDGSVRLRLRCPSACRAQVGVSAGGTVLAHRGPLALRAGHRTTVIVPLTAAGRRHLAGAAAPRTLTATVVLRTAVGNTATVARRLVLRGG